MSTHIFILFFATLIAYLFGSISTGVIVCKCMGLPDPRSQGSGNPGATNVLRFGGIKATVLTLLGDVLKGVIPVLAAKWYGLDNLGLSLVTFATFFGHLYPVFFRFKGGKGVATALGGLLALSWPLGLVLALTWLVVALVFRYSSLAALVTAILAPVYTSYLTNWDFTVLVSVMSLLLIYRHKLNIVKLVRGKEDKIGKKKS